MWQKNTANCYQNNIAWLYKKFVFVAVETFQPIFGWAFFTTGLISLSSILAIAT
ncbi:hypothetical protein [Symbiopectobacterium sp. RP]|uniref:hypothetical protein n=1 Tax=Symbiopectobacterium sp. RP TaxID=3248553 RepID=UPI003D2A8EF5